MGASERYRYRRGRKLQSTLGRRQRESARATRFGRSGQRAAISVPVDLIPFFSTSRNFETSSFVIVPSCSHPGVKDRREIVAQRTSGTLSDYSSRREDWQSG